TPRRARTQLHNSWPRTSQPGTLRRAQASFLTIRFLRLPDPHGREPITMGTSSAIGQVRFANDREYCGVPGDSRSFGGPEALPMFRDQRYASGSLACFPWIPAVSE